MDVLSAIVTLFLVMDPLGNIPPFLSILKAVSPERRRRVLVREIAFAYVVPATIGEHHGFLQHDLEHTRHPQRDR